MEIINGKKISRMYVQELKKRVAALSFQPVFADVIVGDDPVSIQYIEMKEKRARDIGMAVQRVAVPADTTTDNVIGRMDSALQNPDVCGAIVQLPLPAGIDTDAVLDAIPEQLDVDMLGQQSSKKFYNNTSQLVFPAAKAAYELLKTVSHNPAQSHVLVMGQGMLVGSPVTHMLKRDGYSVDVATKTNPATPEMVQQADIIISATGVPGLIDAQHLKEGVIIIDAGTSESDSGIVGDINIDTVSKKAGHIAPVPGGVGPMTVALLLDNVVTVAEHKQSQL